jgi:2-isopropylmalate synthase
VQANCAARTLAADIQPIADIVQRTGLPIECCCFIGSSPIRRYAEDWTVDYLQRCTEEAVGFAVREGLTVMYVTEDTTRSDPDTLRRLFSTAIRAGASRICIADTVGHATPDGARAVVRFVTTIAEEQGGSIGIDWHGHRDRDMGTINSIAAIEAGASRVHGTMLGLGERVGNTPMDLLMVNLVLMGWIERDLTHLNDLVQTVSDATGEPIPDNYPVFGRDAFRTATGVHAAAVVKAFHKTTRSWPTRVLGCAGAARRPFAADRNRSDVRQIQRRVLARAPRSSRPTTRWSSAFSGEPRRRPRC